jgi:tripartite-type tricarboxylate transporter receptor subunit TctC
MIMVPPIRHEIFRQRQRPRSHASRSAGEGAVPAEHQSGQFNMRTIRDWVGAASLLLAAAIAPAQAATYPTRPVTLIADAAPGATPDVDARFVADGLGNIWGKKVIVINRPGANGSIATRAAGEAPHDGYTLFMPTLSTFVALPGIASNIPIKLPRDFLPVGYAAENPMFVAVSPSLPVNNLAELIALAKKEPGKVSIAVTGIGRLTHLTGELLKERAGIQLLAVPYTAGPHAALSDVTAGRVSMIIEGYSGIVGAVKAKQVKLIAVASAKRLPQFPDLPTVSETIPDFTATGWQVVVVPLGTPQPIIDKVSKDLATVVESKGFQTKLNNIGSYSHAMTPAEVLAFVKAEQDKWSPLVAKFVKRVNKR